MNAAFYFPRAAEDLTAYAVERQVGFEQHQGRQFRQPEERNRWIRGILRGMAEVCGADMDAPVRQFDQRLEDARGCFAVEALGLPEQRYTIHSLRRYADQLDLMNGDQRERMMEVKNLLEDITAYLSWDVFRTGVYDAREQVESRLLRMTARRPIRFTRVLVGGDLDPGGAEFVSGSVHSMDGVRGTEMFQKTAQEYPERQEWPAICTVYLGGGREFAVGTIDADELDMAVIREAGDRFLKQPKVRPVCSRELRVPVCQKADAVSDLAHFPLSAPQKAASKAHKRKGAER